MTNQDKPTRFRVGDIELHLSTNPDLPRTHGARIREVGEYGSARGHAMYRFVTIDAIQGEALAVELIVKYGQGSIGGKKTRTTVIGRVTGGEDPLVYVDHRAERAEREIAKLVGTMAGQAFRANERELEKRERAAAERPARLREERARLVARIEEIDRELNPRSLLKANDHVDCDCMSCRPWTS